MDFFGTTNIGMKRQVNQDSFLIREYGCGLLAVVCDGMGGVSGGGEASSTAVTAFTGYTDINFDDSSAAGVHPSEEYCRDVLLSAVRAANNAVYSAAVENRELHGMGTTLVSALVTDDRIYAVNVGDSRMYMIDDAAATQITHDHSYVQYLVDIGKITKDEARNSNNKNIITRAVGTEENVETDFFTVAPRPASGHVLLCTDGLTNHITESDMAQCVNSAESTEKACDELISRANLGGGSDNITAVIISL